MPRSGCGGVSTTCCRSWLRGRRRARCGATSGTGTRASASSSRTASPGSSTAACSTARTGSGNGNAGRSRTGRRGCGGVWSEKGGEPQPPTGSRPSTPSTSVSDPTPGRPAGPGAWPSSRCPPCRLRISTCCAGLRRGSRSTCSCSSRAGSTGATSARGARSPAGTEAAIPMRATSPRATSCSRRGEGQGARYVRRPRRG